MDLDMEPQELKGEVKPSSNAEVSKEMLRVYYRRLFPHRQMCQWLQYGSSEPNIFTNREISFTLADDVYLRFLSFENQDEFEKEICTKIPFKIDIGGVYNARPKNRLAMPKMDPIQRELVFDIDMTDYDEVRTCCKDATVCEKCWKFIVVACQCIDAAIREDFGFQHILWVFSGRRGVHCWVCDKTARHLDNRGRSAIADYLNIFVGATGTGLSRISIGAKMHHSVKRSFKIIEPFFEEIIIQDQDLFATEDGIQKLKSLIPDEQLRKDFDKAMKDTTKNDSASVWDTFVRLVESHNNSGTNKKYRFLVEEVLMAFVYPRLDVNVSKGTNHLLKAPFCVHPKSGKVCVPFVPSGVSRFNPLTAPKINVLLDEINAYDKQEDNDDHQSKIKEFKKTSMFKGMVVFEDFLRKLEASFKTEQSNKVKSLDF